MLLLPKESIDQTVGCRRLKGKMNSWVAKRKCLERRTDKGRAQMESIMRMSSFYSLFSMHLHAPSVPHDHEKMIPRWVVHS
jgi:hypothetical protein